MKRWLGIIGVFCLLLPGCSGKVEQADIAATTLPVYEFTMRLCQGTELTVTRLVTESVSCLHDYSLNVTQVKAAEQANLIVISGGGLEDFMEDVLSNKNTVDASSGITLLCSEHTHDDDHDHGQDAQDPHIWLSPDNAMTMAENICKGLSVEYPRYQATFQENLEVLLADIRELKDYGMTALETISCRDLVTFHDGFAYFAQAFDLTILKAIEEESGSEASAAELKEIISLVKENDLPAVFTEANGSTAAAETISVATGAKVYTLDMAMSGDSWFAAMYQNIDTVKEALE